jgi:hypothetical protein
MAWRSKAILPLCAPREEIWKFEIWDLNLERRQAALNAPQAL